VEKAYLNGHINVICCTSTLAVGVNLPCHLVIIKNTLGRAGRPQFDRSALAVIITRRERVKHFENMMTGQETLESRFHLNLIEHLVSYPCPPRDHADVKQNAEVGLGTVYDKDSARHWLRGTFFYVRLGKNPKHYQHTAKLVGNGIDEMIHHLCDENLKKLYAIDLIAGAGAKNVRSTEFGDAMARYYASFDTMKLFMTLPKKAKTSELVREHVCPA
jgi:ATP-dependent DNA helicase HFM1/MER3